MTDSRRQFLRQTAGIVGGGAVLAGVAQLGHPALKGQSPIVTPSGMAFPSANGWETRISKAVINRAKSDSVAFSNNYRVNRATQADFLAAANSREILHAHMEEIGLNSWLEQGLRSSSSREEYLVKGWTVEDSRKAQQILRKEGLVIYGDELMAAAFQTAEQRRNAIDLVANLSFGEILSRADECIRSLAGRFSTVPTFQRAYYPGGGRFIPVFYDEWLICQMVRDAIAGIEYLLFWSGALEIICLLSLPLLPPDFAGCVLLAEAMLPLMVWLYELYLLAWLLGCQIH